MQNLKPKIIFDKIASVQSKKITSALQYLTQMLLVMLVTFRKCVAKSQKNHATVNIMTPIISSSRLALNFLVPCDIRENVGAPLDADIN